MQNRQDTHDDGTRQSDPLCKFGVMVVSPRVVEGRPTEKQKATHETSVSHIFAPVANLQTFHVGDDDSRMTQSMTFLWEKKYQVRYR